MPPPPRGAGEVCRVFRSRLDPARRTTIVHVNPAFDAPHLGPKPLDPPVPTADPRHADDLPTVLRYPRFAAAGLAAEPTIEPAAVASPASTETAPPAPLATWTVAGAPPHPPLGPGVPRGRVVDGPPPPQFCPVLLSHSPSPPRDPR